MQGHATSCSSSQQPRRSWLPSLLGVRLACCTLWSFYTGYMTAGASCVAGLPGFRLACCTLWPYKRAFLTLGAPCAAGEGAEGDPGEPGAAEPAAPTAEPAQESGQDPAPAPAQAAPAPAPGGVAGASGALLAPSALARQLQGSIHTYLRTAIAASHSAGPAE